MSKPFRTLDDADVFGKRVLLRVDLNVPTENGKVTDATRIERVASTINEIADKGGKVILLAHFGRPKGAPNEAYSLRPVAAAVSEIVKRPVAFATDCIGETRRRRHRQDEERRHPASGEHPLLQGRGKERPGLRRGAGQARRPLCQRRLLRRSPRPRLDRGRRAQATGLCGPRHAGGARGPDDRARRAGAAGRGDRRRGEGLDQARTARQSHQQGRHPDHRRRHGQHLPVRRGQGGRQVAVREGHGRHRRARSWRRRRRASAASCCRSTRWSPRSSRRMRMRASSTSTMSPRTR